VAPYSFEGADQEQSCYETGPDNEQLLIMDIRRYIPVGAGFELH
jgi:hypothetical protein